MNNNILLIYTLLCLFSCYKAMFSRSGIAVLSFGLKYVVFVQSLCVGFLCLILLGK